MKKFKNIFFIAIVGLITLIPISINKIEQKAEQNISYSIEEYDDRLLLFDEMYVTNVTSSSATLNYTLHYPKIGDGSRVFYRQREAYDNVETHHGKWYEDEDVVHGENQIYLTDLNDSVETYTYELILIEHNSGNVVSQEIVGTSSNYFIFELEDGWSWWEYTLVIIGGMFGSILLIYLFMYVVFTLKREDKKNEKS